jgi:ABC-type Na+ efflux pump permease subunit
MSAFWAVVKKELNSVIRDRTIVIAILIQLFIASFSSALLIGMLSLYDPDTIGQYGSMNIRMGLVGPSKEVMTNILRERNIKVTPFAGLEDAKTAFYQGAVNAILVLPADAKDVVDAKLYLPRTEALASLIRMVVQEPLKQYENYLRGERGIEVRYTDIKGKPSTSYEFIYSVILPILMFFPAFVAGGIAVDSISEEVENNTLQTLLSTPLSINWMVAAKVAAAVLLSFCQCIAWLGLLWLNRIRVQNGGWVILLATLVAAIIATGSALVAVWFKDRERSQFVYSLCLLAVTAASYFLDVSPVKVLSRLAIADYYTNAWSLVIYFVFWLALAAGVWRFSRRILA